jgi:hypothetical protein
VRWAGKAACALLHHTTPHPSITPRPLRRKLLDDATAIAVAGGRGEAPAGGVSWVKPYRQGVDGGAPGVGAVMDLSSLFRQVTLEVVSEMTLGFKPHEASVFPALFESVVDELNHRIYKPWRAYLPSAAQYTRRITRLNDIVQERISARRAVRAATTGVPAAAPPPAPSAGAGVGAASSGGGEDADGQALASGEGSGVSASGKAIFAGGCDMLDMLLDCGTSLTDKELSDELKTQLMAGHETSSMMMTWACYLLARHADAFQRVMDEVDTVLGLAPGVTQTAIPAAAVRTEPQPAFKDFRSLAYLE